MKFEIPIGTAPVTVLAVAAACGALLSMPARAQGERQVYRCPGNPVLYTDAISVKEARDKGCRTLEGPPVTIIATPRPRAASSGGMPAASAQNASRPAGQRVDAAEQRARDSDARRILDAELQREQVRYAEMLKEYNNGEPERQGNERNYQKYLDRVADMKSAILRKESDIAAIRRELGKLAP